MPNADGTEHSRGCDRHKGMPISFANVVELLQADSSFIKGTVSKEDGSFMLEGVKSGNVIRVSLIGYETQYINYTGKLPSP